MSSLLAVPDRLALVGVIERLGDLADTRSRNVLLQLANLSRFAASLNLEGAPHAVAANLVIKLENYGPLPDQPGTHALGALLSYVLNLSDLPPSDARILAQAIVKYSLINDEQFVNELRAKFGITGSPVRPPKPGAPVSGAAPVAEPAFNPELIDQFGLETIINSEDNFLDIGLLTGALYCAQAACRIEGSDGKALGTGVLIGPDLVLTNQHVLPNKDHLEGAVARFDYKLIVGTGVADQGRPFAFKTDFFESSPSEQLDYALAKLTAAPLEQMKPEGDLAAAPMTELVKGGKHRGYLPPVSRFLKAGDRVNIIQHPDGNPLKVVMTQNYVATDMRQSRLQYVADTMPGSSGSPVFNNNWELVALHHSGTPYPPESVADTLKKAWKGKFRVNEAIPMRAILADFKARNFQQYLPQ
jgi:V8-like Glu-specific endopeptidase